uniref:Carboxylesterase type B domain-containing protein n=1 Tax=Parascaris univalens TaxID=6257 RepID=A0A914ZBH6_PARUN
IILLAVAMITIIMQPLITCLSVDIIVNTSKGKIRGCIGGRAKSRINIFKGIPFARPPIGSSRFKKPLSVQQWDGIYDGTYYRSACMSNTAYTSSPQKNISEDCLYLNIFADPKCAEGECAVVVYIHGGSFYFQSAVMFDEDSIAEKYASRRIIFVIPAYRLGIFGFISIGDGTFAPKNLGIHDLIAALRWVHTEISTFGGNPNKVTLMGHSCGATTVQLLTLSPNVPDNFFQQGISMSSADLYRRNLSHPITMEIAYRVSCARRGLPYKSEAVVECLRWKPADELLYHQKALTDVDYFDLMFGPEPDEELFAAEVPILLSRQNVRDVGYLLE